MSPDTGKDARAERLAEALRENLKRRKAQARARARKDAPGPASENPYETGPIEPGDKDT